MRKSEILVGLDLGSCRIKAVVADASDRGLPEILGTGESDSRGIESGVIVNMEKASEAIRAAVESAEESADVDIGRILVAGGSAQIPDFAKAFQDRTNVPVQVLNPFERMLPSRKFDEDYLREMAPFMTVGVGLGLRRMDER